MQLRSLIANTAFRPMIFQLFTLVESIRCKRKRGFSEDTLDYVWPYVVEPLNDGAHGVFFRCFSDWRGMAAQELPVSSEM